MKKALIAVSVAAGLVGYAHAENTTTLYGAIGFETQVNKEGGYEVKDTLKDLKDNVWDLDRSTFKWGIKGTEDLNNGLQAFYQMEFGGVESTKKALFGLTGSFGTVTFGKQDSLYKKMTNYNDIFENVYWGDTTHFQAGLGTLDKAISYVSPDLSGIRVGVAGVLDGSHSTPVPSTSKSFVAYQVGAWYNQNGIFAGLGYSHLDDDSFDANGVKVSSGTSEAIGGSVGYENDQFKVGFGAEHQSSTGEVYNLAGEYYYGPNTFRAGFALRDVKGVKDTYTYALGYKYSFSKRTYTYVEGQYVDLNTKGVDNGYTVHIGIRHDF